MHGAYTVLWGPTKESKQELKNDSLGPENDGIKVNTDGVQLRIGSEKWFLLSGKNAALMPIKDLFWEYIYLWCIINIKKSQIAPLI